MSMHRRLGVMVQIVCAAALAACAGDDVTAPASPQFSVGESTEPDTTAPELRGLAIGPRHVNVDGDSGRIQFVAATTDVGSGPDLLVIDLRSPSGAQRAGCNVLAAEDGTRARNTFRCNAWIPRFGEPGTWSIRSLTLRDRSDNDRHYTREELEAAHFPTTVEVASSTPDVTAPRLEALTIDPDSVDVSSGPATIEMRATLADDLSGVERAQFNVVSPSGDQVAWCFEMTFESGDGSSGEWSCTITIDQFAEAGEWRINRFWAWDATGNRREYTTETLEAAGLPTRVTVVSGAADSEPPTLLNIAVSPDSIDLSAGGQSVEVSVTAADTGTGVSRIIAFVGSPDFSSSDGCLASVPVDGDRSSGTFRCSIPIAADAVAGDWKVLDVTITDEVGNDLFLTTADLEAAGHDVTVTVTR